MYQMYAYSKKYHTSDIWLLYPYYSDIEELNQRIFKAIENEGQKVNVGIYLVDLANYRDSIKKLGEVVFKQTLGYD